LKKFIASAPVVTSVKNAARSVESTPEKCSTKTDPTSTRAPMAFNTKVVLTSVCCASTSSSRRSKYMRIIACGSESESTGTSMPESVPRNPHSPYCSRVTNATT
jgi:hypothetical protein